MNVLKKSEVKKSLPVRSDVSHKGQNGRVLIVGGSIDFYGAPVLSGLGALHSGADLVHLFVPEVNFECTRSMYPDFVVHKYPGEYLTQRYAEKVIKFAKNVDSILIGPGLGDQEKTAEAVLDIIKNVSLPTVLDADAIGVLKRVKKFPLKQPIVITPHSNEFRHLVDRDIEVKTEDTKSIILLRSISMDLHINVLLKGPCDYVSSVEGEVVLNKTGNAGMTVGGSGDVLAGMVASFLAQRLEGFEAAKCAAFYCGAAGDLLQKHKGVYFSASDLALALPAVLK